MKILEKTREVETLIGQLKELDAHITEHQAHITELESEKEMIANKFTQLEAEFRKEIRDLTTAIMNRRPWDRGVELQ